MQKTSGGLEGSGGHDESNNSKMLDSNEFVLNNTMSSCVLNTHRDEGAFQTRQSDYEPYGGGAES